MRVGRYTRIHAPAQTILVAVCDANRASVLLHNAHAYPQPQAGAGFTFCGEERLEQILLHLAVDSRPAIRHFHEHSLRPVIFSRRGVNQDIDFSALACGIGSIDDQVGEYLT